MGYRSDVKICLKKENFDELKSMAQELENEHERHLLDDEYLGIKKLYKDGTIVFGWDYIKWYEFQDGTLPHLINNYLIDLLADNIPYSFIRMGEDNDDIEINENYEENGICSDKIFVVREIGCEEE